jgi:O-antigen/teichoic acid export membrane protein
LGTIQKQGIINTIIIYIGVALGFLNRIVVQPKYLKPEEIGLATTIISFSGLLTTFFLLGSSSSCVKFFASFRDKESRHHGFFGLILLISLTGIFIFGIIFFSLNHWLLKVYSENSPLFASYFFWMFPLGVIMTLSIVVNAYSSSLLKTTMPSFLNDIWVRIVLIAFTFAYSLNWISLDFFIASIFITYLSQLVFISMYVYVIDRPSLLPDWNFVRKIGVQPIVRFSIFMSLTALSSLSLKFLDNVFISAYLPLKFAAIYSIGAFIAQFIETPLYSLERVAGIKIAHSFQENNMEEIKKIYYQSVRMLFLFGGFLVVCIVCNIYDFLQLLPDTFRGAANVTIIISIGSIINMATGVNSPIINNSEKYRWSMIFLLILLVTTVILNMILIPKYGIVGSAVATGLSSTLFNLLKFFFIWKNFGMQPYDKNTVKTIFVIGISLLVGIFIPVPQNPWMAMAIRGISISAVYASFSYFLKIVPEYHGLFLRMVKRK